MSGHSVGYGKPPKQGQFKKGKSGNPKGRPKGSRNLKIDLIDELYGRITITEHGRQKTLTKQQVLIKKLMAEALMGDHKARSLLLNLIAQCERAGALVPPNTPTSDEDRRILERFLASNRNTKKGE